jgi:hypothetical protein
MQRSRILVVSATICFAFAAPQLAIGGQRGGGGHHAMPSHHGGHHGGPRHHGGHTGHHHSGHHHNHLQPHPVYHPPAPMPPQVPVRVQRITVTPQTVVQPIAVPFPVGGTYITTPEAPVYGERIMRGPFEGYIPPAPPTPSSFNVISPFAAVGQTPSGRIVVSSGSSYGGGHQMVTPYAPPAVHVIGNRRHHSRGAAVHIIEGTAAPRRMRTTPQIIVVRAGGHSHHDDHEEVPSARVIKRY